MSNRPKVFFIGYNKTATTSLHRLFKESGYTSYHTHKNKDRWLGIQMLFNRTMRVPILETIDDGDAYSDMSYFSEDTCINANEYFVDLYEEYPTAYFIMNLRDTEDWIQSRTNHPNFVERAMQYMGTDDLEVVQQRWRSQRNVHLIQARSFFYTLPDSNYLEFWVDEDPIDKLSEFVSDHYDLKLDAWQMHNVTQ